jgi:hypothetical protein
MEHVVAPRRPVGCLRDLAARLPKLLGIALCWLLAGAALIGLVYVAIVGTGYGQADGMREGRDALLGVGFFYLALTVLALIVYTAWRTRDADDCRVPAASAGWTPPLANTRLLADEEAETK